ncbi:rhomboid family intramembrane serine protease [Leptospira jelokensis]|uniref:rhomboid family intramembrane serine protease n=1 Tax=Leptospira jelokensis TaxID=2484931 RepID=UPI001090F4B5|nr:rhomboid family intramembrane serine protease [Leptospira jelokensis]TGM01294.1 rhomboid family intramembrane serine protease [Leptospira jelokensis]
MSRNRSQGPSLFGNPILHPLNVILIINSLVFFLQYFANQQLIYRFGLTPDFVLSGAIWQVFTYGFLHAVEALPLHLLFNMYAMYMLGNNLIPIIGKTKFTILYFLSQIGAGIFVVLSAYLNIMLGGQVPVLESMASQTIGASGAVFGLLALFGLFYPNAEILLFIIPVKAKNAVWVSIAIGYLISQFGNGSISNTCHLGGALTALLLVKLFPKHFLPSTVPYLPGLEWEAPRQNEPSPNAKAKQAPVEDLFLDQKKINESVLKQIESKRDRASVINYLQPLQVENANICPPSTYNTEDPICLRCEWLPNCALRRAKE